MIHMLILLRTILPNLDVSRGKESRNICNRWRNSSRIRIPKIITTYNVAQGFSIKCYRTCQIFALRPLHDLLRPFGAYLLQVAPVWGFYKSPQSWPPMVQYARIHPRGTFLLPKPCHMYSTNPPLIIGTWVGHHKLTWFPRHLPIHVNPNCYFDNGGFKGASFIH